MSKNVTIKQNGTAKNFASIDKIRTNLIAGSTSEWVPEDERLTIVKRITKNGKYVASQRDGVYGFTAVFVDVPIRSVTGVDPVDGKTYRVSKNSNGELVWTEINDE